jgi:four helix bundle protein
MQQKDNLIVDLTFNFSLKIIAFTDILEKAKKFTIANQLLKSGTSIGANVRESQHAESRLDFVHKLKIASKEANETVYWLLLCKHSNIYSDNCDDLIESCNSICKVLTKIIVSTKR